MQVIQIRSRVDPDGILRLRVPELPVKPPNAELDVLIVLRPRSEGGTDTLGEKIAWIPGFFEQTAGCWQGEPLERADQGDYEVRRELA